MYMKNIDTILVIALLSMVGCKNPTDSTSENGLTTKDSSIFQYVLSGKIIYSKAYWDKSGDVSSTINVLNLKNYSQYQIISFNNSTITNMALSPDSSALAYVRYDVKSLKVVIAKIYVDTVNASEIIVSSSELSPLRLFPNWTHDNKLAYLSFENLNWKLIVEGSYVNVDKSIALSKVAFTNNGKILIYSFQDDSSHTSLYAYDFSKQSSQLLLKTDARYNNCKFIEPSISSDCSTVVFIKEYSNVSNSGVWLEGGDEIWIVNIDGTNPRMIKKGANNNPVWSPDGKYIAYLTADQIFIMNKDGSNAIKLNSNTYKEFIWSN
jgi:Tol biopolymer transport system component